MPFNPNRLTPTASLNRVRIVVDDADESTRTAYDVLGAHALYSQMRHCASTLHLPRPLPDQPTAAVMEAFQHAFVSEDENARRTAETVRGGFLFWLAALLLILRRGNALDRERRPEWDASYWDYWRSVPRIVVGGGLLRGHIGTAIPTLIPQMLAAYTGQFAPFTLDVDAHGPYWPLIGAACTAARETAVMAVLDFGGTSVKTGIAHYEDGTLKALNETAAFPGPLGEPYSLSQQGDDAKQRVFDSMTERIVQTIQTTPHDAVQQAAVSLATYIDPTGHPYPNSSGGYAALHTLAPNLQTALTDAVSTRLGRPITLRLLHDGTAAATLYPGAAVMVLGTAIGVGTHAAVANPRPLAHDFTLSSST